MGWKHEYMNTGTAPVEAGPHLQEVKYQCIPIIEITSKQFCDSKKRKEEGNIRNWKKKCERKIGTEKNRVHSCYEWLV